MLVMPDLVVEHLEYVAFLMVLVVAVTHVVRDVRCNLMAEAPHRCGRVVPHCGSHRRSRRMPRLREIEAVWIVVLQSQSFLQINVKLGPKVVVRLLPGLHDQACSRLMCLRDAELE